MTATSWLSFREFNGLLVYYTRLMSNRCAISARRHRQRRAGQGLLAPSTQSVSVQLTYRDGSVSEISSFGAERSIRGAGSWTRVFLQNGRRSARSTPDAASSAAVRPA
jgi:hypothetical protein